MIAADQPHQTPRKLLVVDQYGEMRHLERNALGSLFEPGDVVVANDAATLPASLRGVHEPTGDEVEVRLAAFVDAHDPTRFLAVAFGAGDHRTVTEERELPPVVNTGDRLLLGTLTAVVDLVEHPRLLMLQFEGTPAEVFAGLAQHGRPIQYAHVPAPLALWDVWTNTAARPFAFEAPSAGFALDWATIASWRRRGVEVVTLTHAAGISSTGDPELDSRLPFDEPYVIPGRTADAIHRARAQGGSVIAIGTTVVRALEAAATADSSEDGGDHFVRVGEGVATGRIGPETELRVVDSVLTGMHEPGESHFELLRAFIDDDVLHAAHRSAIKRAYRSHEFGDSLIIERSRGRGPRRPRRRRASRLPARIRRGPPMLQH